MEFIIGIILIKNILARCDYTISINFLTTYKKYCGMKSGVISMYKTIDYVELGSYIKFLKRMANIKNFEVNYKYNRTPFYDMIIHNPIINYNIYNKMIKYGKYGLYIHSDIDNRHKNYNNILVIMVLTVDNIIKNIKKCDNDIRDITINRVLLYCGEQMIGIIKILNDGKYDIIMDVTSYTPSLNNRSKTNK